MTSGSPSYPHPAEVYLEVAQVMMLGLDPTGRVSMINPMGCQLLGYTKEEIVGKDWFTTFLPPETAQQVKKIFLQTLADSQSIPRYNENQICRKDGSRLLIAWHNSMVSDENGQLVEILSSGVDITEQHERVQRHKELTMQHLAILDGLDVVVYVADMDTYEILYLNDFARQQMGEIDGRKCYEMLQVGQTGPCDFCTNDKLIDAQGQPTGPYIWEFQNTRFDTWSRIVDKAITWADGRIVRLEVAPDITNLKQAQAENLALIAKLEKALEEVDTLRGIIPICSFCKKVRDDQGFWDQVERYFGKRSGAEFSHGICPECMEKNFPEI
jgi:PAS domain S-box-containing protein